MLTVTYDARNGIPFRDGEIDAYMDEIVDNLRAGNSLVIDFSTENFFLGIICAIKEARIDPRQVQVRFTPDGGETYLNLPMDDLGDIDLPWPAGFCDKNSALCVRIIIARRGSPAVL